MSAACNQFELLAGFCRVGRPGAVLFMVLEWINVVQVYNKWFIYHCVIRNNRVKCVCGVRIIPKVEKAWSQTIYQV